MIGIRMRIGLTIIVLSIATVALFEYTLSRNRKVERAVVEQAQEVPFAGALNGEAIFLSMCVGCHTSRVDMAPPLYPGAWTERAAQGRAALYLHAIEGYQGPGGRYMPPKGGNGALTDAQVRATVDWMLDQVGAPGDAALAAPKPMPIATTAREEATFSRGGTASREQSDADSAATRADENRKIELQIHRQSPAFHRFGDKPS